MDFSSIIVGRTGTQFFRNFVKTPTTTSTPSMRSTWAVVGTPTGGSAPGSTPVIPTDATTGAVPLPSLAGGSFYYLDRMTLLQGGSSPFMLFASDRLYHMSGLSGSNTGTQTVGMDLANSALNDRRGNADYGDVSWFLEWYNTTGATPTTATITYTNGAGTSGRTTTVAIPASASQDLMLLITGSGGEAIKSIQSLQLGPSTGGIGDFGVTATRRIAWMVQPGYAIPQPRIWRETGLTKIASDSCLFFHMYGFVTGAQFNGKLYLISSSD